MAGIPAAHAGFYPLDGYLAESALLTMPLTQ